MQVNYSYPLTFAMTVPLFTEEVYKMESRFFNKMGLLIIYIFQKRSQGRFQT